MTDKELSDEVKNAAEALQDLVTKAASEGLHVEIDATTISTHAMGNNPSVPMWRITASVSRPL